jgi:hypothetical protein
MPSVYCCYNNEVYISCHNTMDEANYHLERAIENKAKKNLLNINGIPERICACEHSYMFDQLLRGLGVFEDAVTAEMSNVRSEFSIQEKTIV